MATVTLSCKFGDIPGGDGTAVHVVRLGASLTEEDVDRIELDDQFVMMCSVF